LIGQVSGDYKQFFPQVTTGTVIKGFAGFHRSGASSLQLVEQYFRFLKVFQEFSGSEPTNKGNDLMFASIKRTELHGSSKTYDLHLRPP
jgi:hypothetical protein